MQRLILSLVFLKAVRKILSFKFLLIAALLAFLLAPRHEKTDTVAFETKCGSNELKFKNHYSQFLIAQSIWDMWDFKTPHSRLQIRNDRNINKKIYKGKLSKSPGATLYELDPSAYREIYLFPDETDKKTAELFANCVRQNMDQIRAFVPEWQRIHRVIYGTHRPLDEDFFCEDGTIWSFDTEHKAHKYHPGGHIDAYSLTKKGGELRSPDEKISELGGVRFAANAPSCKNAEGKTIPDYLGLDVSSYVSRNCNNVLCLYDRNTLNLFFVQSRASFSIVNVDDAVHTYKISFENYSSPLGFSCPPLETDDGQLVIPSRGTREIALHMPRQKEHGECSVDLKISDETNVISETKTKYSWHLL